MDAANEYIAEARREAQQMGFNSLKEAVDHLRQKVSKLGLLNEGLKQA